MTEIVDARAAGSDAVVDPGVLARAAALLRAGIASLERVAQDGMRIRAGAGAASFRRRSAPS